jgi:hypothetical protein
MKWSLGIMAVVAWLFGAVACLPARGPKASGCYLQLAGNASNGTSLLRSPAGREIAYGRPEELIRLAAAMKCPLVVDPVSPAEAVND